MNELTVNERNLLQIIKEHKAGLHDAWGARDAALAEIARLRAPWVSVDERMPQNGGKGVMMDEYTKATLRRYKRERRNNRAVMAVVYALGGASGALLGLSICVWATSGWSFDALNGLLAGAMYALVSGALRGIVRPSLVKAEQAVRELEKLQPCD